MSYSVNQMAIFIYFFGGWEGGGEGGGRGVGGGRGLLWGKGFSFDKRPIYGINKGPDLISDSIFFRQV